MTPGGASSHDVVVIGDGPAGSALALACARVGIDVVLVGADDAWTPTYGTWVDDLEAVTMLDGHDVLASRHADIVAWTTRRHELHRTYGVVDNGALRTVLRRGVHHRVDRVTDVRPGERRHVVETAAGDTIACRLVVDATGWPAAFAGRTTGSRRPGWQTAFGAVLAARPAGDLGRATLMDFRAPSARPGDLPAPASTFVYCLQVADGWLVEETVLAARPAVDPDALAARLARRLDITVGELADRAVRVERVRIPMGVDRPRRDQPVVGFGAAAAYGNPTSGYSIVHSMRVAPAVADSIAAALGAATAARVASSASVWESVWPVSARRARVLHDYGLDVLMRLDADAVRAFFGSFFELPVPTWSAYMRADAEPAELARAMGAMFRSAPWSIRRRLLAANPLALAPLLRPA